MEDCNFLFTISFRNLKLLCYEFQMMQLLIVRSFFVKVETNFSSTIQTDQMNIFETLFSYTTFGLADGTKYESEPLFYM